MLQVGHQIAPNQDNSAFEFHCWLVENVYLPNSYIIDPLVRRPTVRLLPPAHGREHEGRGGRALVLDPVELRAELGKCLPGL